MIYRVILLLLAAGATVLYSIAPNALNFPHPESARILFFHAPEAMLCMFFFMWSAIMSLRYIAGLKAGVMNVRFDMRSLAANEVGFLLALLATLTGMAFAYEQWGTAWNWDPRQLSIFVLLLIYAAYFALRAGFSRDDFAKKAAGAYNIFAFLTAPFLIWVFPRLPAIADRSQHGNANKAVIGGGLDPTYRIIFYTCAVVIGLVAIWAYKMRVGELEEKNEIETVADTSTDPGVVRPVRIRDVK